MILANAIVPTGRKSDNTKISKIEKQKNLKTKREQIENRNG